MALHGYPSAHVTLRSRATDDPMRALVLVDVTPGAPQTIRDRHVYVFGAREDEVEHVTRSYAVAAGDRTDHPAIDAADAALQQAMRAHGWSRAIVSHDLVWAGPLRRVVLRVRVDAGARQVTRYEGNEHYDAAALDGALELDTETDRTASHLADKIRVLYQKRAFLDAEVTPEVRGEDRDPRAGAALSRRRARAREGHGAPLPLPQARRDPPPVERRPAVGRGDRDGDRELSRRGAARHGPPGGAERSRAVGHDRRRRRTGRDGRPPRAARPASGRDVRGGHVRPRRRARAGALPQRGLPPRARGPRERRPGALRSALAAGELRRRARAAARGADLHVRRERDPAADRSARRVGHVPRGPCPGRDLRPRARR